MCESQSFYGGGVDFKTSVCYNALAKVTRLRSIRKHLTPYANDSQLQQLIENITNTRESTYIDIIHKYILLRYHGIHLFHHQP